MGLDSFATAAIAVGFVVALLATQWWAWMLASLLAAGTSVLYALAAAASWRPVVAVGFLLLAVVCFGFGQAMMFWLQPDRRARARAGETLPRVVWRQGIAFGGVLLVGFVLALWPRAWWLPGPLSAARVRLVGAPAVVVPPRRFDATPNPHAGVNWDKLSDGTRYAISQSLNRPSLCPGDRGEVFLADCQRYATSMAEVPRDDLRPDARAPAQGR